MGYRVIARYGSMGLLGEFHSHYDVRRGDNVLLKTDRGTEAALIVSVHETSDADGAAPSAVIRQLDDTDRRELRRIGDEAIPKEMAYCRERIRELNLPMKIVDAEHLLGGEKIIFYFVADGRVDFRQLVKDVAREYKTRIELRQIGVRDEARLLSELGHCGQRLCCKSFMKNLEPVTMRMAKSQKATLDPTKISGSCGRLMCCLRYEDKVYTELKSRLPRRGSIVSTRKATGKVVDFDVLAQILTVRTSDTTIIRVPMSEVVSIEGRPTGVADEDETPDAAEDRQQARPQPQQRSERPPRDERRRDDRRRGDDSRRQDNRPPQGDNRNQGNRPPQQGDRNQGNRPPQQQGDNSQQGNRPDRNRDHRNRHRRRDGRQEGRG